MMDDVYYKFDGFTAVKIFGIFFSRVATKCTYACMQNFFKGSKDSQVSEAKQSNGKTNELNESDRDLNNGHRLHFNGSKVCVVRL